LTQKFGVGGTLWVRKVNDREDEGPFDNSFQEYHVNADYFPTSALEVGAEYRFRHLSRDNPEHAQFFFDIGREGEKKFHEVYANAAYHFLGSRLTLEGGLFYRRFDTQSRLISLEGADTTGYTAGIKWRIARDYKLLLEYGFDKELAFLNPDIDYTQQFRVRFEWRFNR
jgi:opacity protein-like surface antigen